MTTTATKVKNLKIGDTFTIEDGTYTVTYIHPTHRTGRGMVGLAATNTTTGTEKGFTFPATATITRTR